MGGSLCCQTRACRHGQSVPAGETWAGQHTCAMRVTSSPGSGASSTQSPTPMRSPSCAPRENSASNRVTLQGERSLCLARQRKAPTMQAGQACLEQPPCLCEGGIVPAVRCLCQGGRGVHGPPNPAQPSAWMWVTQLWPVGRQLLLLLLLCQRRCCSLCSLLMLSLLCKPHTLPAAW